MPKNYILQNYKITGVTDKDLTGAVNVRMYYKKPDATTGFWVATVEHGANVVYNTSPTEIDQAGSWTFLSICGKKQQRAERRIVYHEIL
jgi:hypothetical protein